MKNSSSSKNAAEPPRRTSQAVAFGRNYFYALGGTQPQMLEHSDGERVAAYTWNEPPWQQPTKRKEKKSSQHHDIAQAVCTAQSTVFLTSGGQVYQTGTLHGRIYTTPHPVVIPMPLKCVQIAAGRHFCLGRMEGGLAVVSWGAGHFGQLGIGTPSSDNDNSNNTHHLVTFTPQPVVIERLLPHVIGSAIQSVSAGDWHALALTESGRVWAWGSNRNLQCGRKHHHNTKLSASSSNTSAAPTITVPLPVPLEVPASQIAAGRAHSVAVARDSGRVYCWGSSNHGQCGSSVRRSSGIAPPRLVDGMSDLNICQVTAAGNHTMALTTGGRVFSWGAGSEGELGLASAIPSQCKPRLVADLDFIAIAAGQEWKHQQQQRTRKEDTESAPLSEIPRIASIFAGASYSAAISTSGHVYIWGSNDAGQIGIPTPEAVPLKDGFHGLDQGHSSLRDLHVRTFDSRHNILLPIRVDSAASMRVRLMACGPNHLWCIGEGRSAKEQPVVGKTMYEVQEVQRAMKLQRSRDAIRATSRLEKDCDGTTEVSQEALYAIPPSTPETSVQTMSMSNPELSSKIMSPDISASSANSPLASSSTKLKSPKSEKSGRPKLLPRFSLRKVISRMSSGRSDNGDLDDSERSRRGRGRRANRGSSM